MPAKKSTSKTEKPTEKAAGKPAGIANNNNDAPTDHTNPDQVGKKNAQQATEAGGPLPHGVVPDQVQINQALGVVGNELLGLHAVVEKQLAGTDHSKLTALLEKAQKWVVDQRSV